MTEWTMQSSGPDAQILSRRLGAFIRARGSAKEIAARIDCDERTAKNIRSGATWPIARHWLNIWIEFGDDVLEAVFHPERAQQRLELEAAARDQDRQRRLAALRPAHLIPEGGPSRGRQTLARHEDRSAALTIAPD